MAEGIEQRALVAAGGEGAGGVDLAAEVAEHGHAVAGDEEGAAVVVVVGHAVVAAHGHEAEAFGAADENLCVGEPRARGQGGGAGGARGGGQGGRVEEEGLREVDAPRERGGLVAGEAEARGEPGGQAHIRAHIHRAIGHGRPEVTADARQGRGHGGLAGLGPAQPVLAAARGAADGLGQAGEVAEAIGPVADALAGEPVIEEAAQIAAHEHARRAHDQRAFLRREARVRQGGADHAGVADRVPIRVRERPPIRVVAGPRHLQVRGEHQAAHRGQPFGAGGLGERRAETRDDLGHLPSGVGGAQVDGDGAPLQVGAVAVVRGVHPGGVAAQPLDRLGQGGQEAPFALHPFRLGQAREAAPARAVQPLEARAVAVCRKVEIGLARERRHGPRQRLLAPPRDSRQIQFPRLGEGVPGRAVAIGRHDARPFAGQQRGHRLGGRRHLVELLGRTRPRAAQAQGAAQQCDHDPFHGNHPFAITINAPRAARKPAPPSRARPCVRADAGRRRRVRARGRRRRACANRRAARGRRCRPWVRRGWRSA